MMTALYTIIIVSRKFYSLLKKIMGKDIFKKWLSGVTIVSLLINSLLPYGLVRVASAQETTPVIEEATASSETSLPTEPPSASPTPLPTTTPDFITATPSPSPAPTDPPSPGPSIDPTSTSTPSATPEASPTPSPSASPATDATPTASTDPAIASQEKAPVRKEGNFLKERREDKKNYVEGEVIVKFRRDKLDVARALGSLEAYVFETKHSLNRKSEIKDLNIRVFKSKKSTKELVNELRSDPNVEYAQPNYIYEPSTIETDDPYRDLLWGLDNPNDFDIDAPEAWALSEGSGDVVVAVIDSGVAYNHPDLSANMWDGTNCKDENGNLIGGCNSGYDYEENDKDPSPSSSSHGTHIAGTIAAAKNNGIGTIGVAPNVKIMAIKTSFTSAENVKGIYFAKQNGARVINASWLCYGSDQGGGPVCGTPDYDDLAMIEAINNFPGLVITAAGNGLGDTDDEGDNHDSGQTLHGYPCDHNASNIICVAATDQNDNLALFSDYGVTSVDVGAPGVNIYSTGFLVEDFSNATPPSFTNTIFTKTAGGWKTGTWGDVGGNVNDKNAQANSSYLDNDDGSLMLTNPLTVQNINSNVMVTFYLYENTEVSYLCLNDYFSIQTDNNDGNWTEEAYACGYDNGYYQVDLGTATPDMRLRFVWHTNEAVTGIQVPVIDDIEITNTLSYQYMEGTSMAAPHVAGLAGLIWSYQPGLTYSQVKDAILSTGDPAPDLVGKTSTGRRINALKALQSVTAPTITDLSNDTTPTKSKTWEWDSNDPTAQFRYLIDQVESSEPTGTYSDVKTAIQSSGDGVYYIHVQAKSAAGVEGPVTTVSAILDNTTPIVEITSPIGGSKVNGHTLITFTDNELASPQCSINNTDWSPCTSGTTVLADVSGFNGLAEGLFTLYIRDTDVAGNIGVDESLG